MPGGLAFPSGGSFSPVNAPSGGAAASIPGALQNFLQAAQGVMAIQKAKRDQAQQQLTALGQEAHGDPSRLDDPQFKAQVKSLATHAGIPGSAISDNPSAIAGILGLPSLSDVASKPGVLGGLEEADPGSGRTAGASLVLGRPLSASEDAQVQALPQQYPPQQQAAMQENLTRQENTAVSNAAKYGNPDILIQYFRSNQQTYEKLYGKDAAKQMIDGSLAQAIGQMSPLQLSQIQKNQAQTGYLKERGIEVADLLDAKKQELLTRSVAHLATANMDNVVASLGPAKASLWRSMAGEFDGKSDLEKSQSQQTREEVSNYLATGMLPADISRVRSDYMTQISKNRGLVAGLQKQYAAFVAKGVQQQMGKPPALAQQQFEDGKQAILDQINSYQGVVQQDTSQLNQLNSAFSRGVLAPNSAGNNYLPGTPSQPVKGVAPVYDGKGQEYIQYQDGTYRNAKTGEVYSGPSQ
jgi:hypothetical protein